MDVDAQRQRVQELWFEDGNLVIQAGNSLYRVFRGILAARSPVFADMHSLPQPIDSELVEGCPVVHLHDAPTEVTAFLKAIFEPEFFMPFPAATDFDTICGCLRLSHKYGVEYLRRRALVHLSSRHPSALSDFDVLINSMALSTSWKRPEIRSYAILLIQVCREVDALWIIPYGFYVLAYYFGQLASEIFHGTVYKDLSVSLSAADQPSFLRGYLIQRDHAKDEVLRFLLSPVKIQGCTDVVRCLQERVAAFNAVSGNHSEPGQATAPLHIWSASEWGLLRKACPTCLESLKTTFQEARQAFWDKLPEIYGLPPWEELRKMKADAMSELPS
ncbi:hypothetical protein C8R47DRAFT_10947 [Mycena vitilis]|nr:hypothetical protein C8R47DRAFT_10947 [Mycena vitilis]